MRTARGVALAAPGQALRGAAAVVSIARALAAAVVAAPGRARQALLALPATAAAWLPPPPERAGALMFLFRG